MRNAILLLILSMLLACGVGCTDTGRYTISGKGSTLGLGGEFTTAIKPDINARVGYNMLDIDFDDEEVEDVEYDIGIDFSSFTALADWYIFNDSFRLSGGIVSMDHEVDLDARPTKPIEIGDVEYSPAEVGSLYGNVEIDDVAPYIGIGWGNPLTSSRRWGFTTDFGVIFSDTPDVTLNARGGTLSGDPAFLAELEKERKDIEDFFDDLKIYPVIAVSFFYRF
jgi:hypothetical protein